MNEKDIINEYSSLSLAYIGDAVYELMVREKLILLYKKKNGDLHNLAKNYVSASSQSKSTEYILEHFNDIEKEVYFRARNTSPHHTPSNVSVQEYHNATALEAVFGFLFLNGQEERIEYLFNSIFDYLS